MRLTSRKQAELSQLEADLKAFMDKLVGLREFIERDTKNRHSIEKEIFSHSRDLKFFKEKNDQLDPSKLANRLNLVKLDVLELQAKAKRLSELKRSLELFDGMEPTNEELSNRVDELSKSRLSLEMSFVDGL